MSFHRTCRSENSMNAATNDSRLVRSLCVFRDRLNDHPRARSLLRDWDRDISVEATDTEERAVMVLRNTKIEALVSAPGDAQVVVTVRAPRDLLCAVFSGEMNPTTLFLDGALQVFATDRDQMKLDALSLLLWD